MAVRGQGGLVVAVPNRAESLANARAVAERLVLDLRTELDGIIAAQEADPPDDEHDVEGSSVGFERARVTALLASAEASLAGLRDADRRVAEGDDGRCESCGAPIGEDRLAAMPTTRRCVACAAPPPRRLHR